MRNEYKSIFIVLKIAFKPVDMFGIEVVSWLVKKQDIWFFKE